MTQDKSKNSRKPLALSLTQQTMKAFQPMLSPCYVIIIYLCIFVFFLPIGAAILVSSLYASEDHIEYSCCPNSRPEPGATCSCTVSYTPSRDMYPPVFLYYRLTNFYQNHRRYAASRDDSQFSGYAVSSASSNCYPLQYYANKNSPGSVSRSIIYNPCGLIAWSMFNDTISLVDGGDGSTVCNGTNPESSSCTKTGIAWWSDVSAKFKAPGSVSGENNRINPAEYYNEPGHLIPRVTDEDFMVWMRTAALPDFKKLYRIINKKLEKGRTYTIVLQDRFPVATFGGKKYAVFATQSFFGGQNYVLAGLYIAVAVICLLLAIGFGFVGIVQKLIQIRLENKN